MFPNRSAHGAGSTGSRGGTDASTASSSSAALAARAEGSTAIAGPALRSITVSRVSKPVPRRAYTRPWTAIVNETRASPDSGPNAPFQAASPGAQLADVTATSLPPLGSIEQAERTCRKSAPRRLRETPGVAENGGFISTTEGRRCGRKSASDSPLWRVTSAFGKSPASIAARTGAISLRCSAPASFIPSAHWAMTASIPVPAEGSSTVSPGRTAAAFSAT